MFETAMHFPTRKDDSSAREPEFLRQRVDHYHRERAANPVTGTHPLKGRTPGERSIQLNGNDYLALAGHPRILAAQAGALQRSGQGALRSGVFHFGDHPQRVLERRLARWAKAGDAMLCQSGWCANVGLVQSIADAHTPVYVDMLAHRSLWEGIKSAGATPRPFRHNDPASLERLVRRHGAGVILVDAVYSTTGAVAPLRDFAAVSRQHGCVLVVDESHSLGLHGRRGEGLVPGLGLARDVDFRTASLSKAFAGRGGVVLGRARHVEYLRYEALPAIFSSALLPHELAGVEATLQVIRGAHARRRRLAAHAQWLREALDGLGYNVSAGNSQIIALEPGAEHDTIYLRDALEAREVFGSVFVPPATARNRCLVRLSLNAGLEREHLEHVVRVCAAIREEVGMARWPSTRHKAASAPAGAGLSSEPGLALAV